MNREKRTKIIQIFFATIVAVLAVWFYTPLPTNAARWVWNTYHASAVALALDRTDAELAFDIGNRSFGMGGYDLPVAEQAFRKTIAIDPEFLMGHYQIARVLFVNGDLTGADAEINQELAHHYNNYRAFYVRALIRAYNHDLPGAESDFKQFIWWAPNEWAGYNDLAWVLGQEFNYKEAEMVLKEALNSATGAKTNPWIWNNLGVQQLNLKEFKAAVTSFENAKKFAASLNEKTWKASYPGNDPSGGTSGIKQFQAAIETNLTRARAGY